jgi:hypothetical protein
MGARAAIGWLACLCSWSLFAQTPPLSPEFPVSMSLISNGGLPAVAASALGQFVVVWQADGSDGHPDVYARVYDSNGNAFGDQFVVNGYTPGYQYQPAVAADPGGNFVVVWTSDQNDVGYGNIWARRYDASGTALGGEFEVNTYTTYGQYVPAVAMDAAGNFVVVWGSDGQDGSGGGLFGQVFDSTGNPVGSEFPVNQYTTSDQRFAKVAFGGDGNFVVAWESSYQDGSGYAVEARRFAGDGTPLSDEILVNTRTTGNQHFPVVAADGAGDFVIAWASFAQDGDSGGIFAQRFGSAGQRIGGEFPVNTDTTGNQGSPTIGMDRKGNFTIAWSSQPAGGVSEIRGQRYDPAGNRIGGEFPVSTSTAHEVTPAIALAPEGRFVAAWFDYQAAPNASVLAVMAAPVPSPLLVDTVPPATRRGAEPDAAALNGILEPGETVTVAPSWTNDTPNAFHLTGTASNLIGPPGATYTLAVSAADYSILGSGAKRNCIGFACYEVGVSNPAARPAPHWDATFDETLSSGGTKTWTLHVGESFPDVPDSQPFYPYVENLFHNGITGGCGSGSYCPAASVTRAQMAVFLLKAKHGSSFVPPACTGIFPDVACPSTFADWIEELSHEGITGGCGGGDYCPSSPVTRQQMAVFLLKDEHGSAYAPPACVGIFTDVTCPSQFADWIEQLSHENVTGGCGGGNFCPTNPNTRGQMAVFLVKTFGLLLYGS